MSMVLQINPNDDSPMSSARWVPATEAQKAKMGPDRPFFSEEGLTFADVLDIVNPLQHLPIIGPLYREITGDTISPGARLMGGTIFGGPLGLVGAAFELGVEQEFGRDPGGMILAAVSGEEIAPAYNKTANLIGEVIPGETPAAATPTGDVASAAGVQVEPLAPPTGAVLPATVTPPASGGIAFNSSRAPISLTAGLIQAHTAPVSAAAMQAAPPVAAAVAAPATPLPATGQPIALGPTVSTSAPIGAPAGQQAPASPAGNAAAAASGISLPPGSTGLLTSSGLPSAGSITPALTMLQTQAGAQVGQAGAQAGQAAPAMPSNPTGNLTGNAGVAAYQATREAPAVHPTAGQAAPATAPVVADGGQRWFELPTNRAPVNTGARVPPVLNRADVKTSQAATAQLAGDVAPAQVLNPITPTAATGQPAVVSDAMKSALDKYDALLKSRQAGGGLNRTF